MFDSVHVAAAFVSLALTPATIIACIAVLVMWSKGALKSVWSRHKTDVQWFMIGVVISFVGAAVDNLYWGLAWLADYTGSSLRDALFRNGVYSNVPFRQVCTVIAAGCHIKAALGSDSAIFRRCVYVFWSVTLLSAYALMLTDS